VTQLTTAVAPPTVRSVRARFPAGDPASVRATGARLAGEADALAQLVWRLRADHDAMAAERRWCSPASAAYDVAGRAQCARVDQVARVLRTAGDACSDYASQLEAAQSSARTTTVWADRVVRDQDELHEGWRRLGTLRSAELAGRPAVVGAGSLFATAPTIAAQQQSLEARGASLAAEAVRIEAQAMDAARRAESAAARLAATLTDLSRMTTAARSRAATTRHEELVAAGELPAEDGSVRSRISGLLSGAASDVTDSVDLMVRLGGGHGDPTAQWRSLGGGLVQEATHPLQLLRDLADWRDLQQHDWGHWTGVQVPSGLLTVGTDGLFAAVKVLHSAQVLVGRHAAEDLRRLVEADRLAAETRALLAAADGRTLSALVPIGGLAWHEAAGGHLLDRHVAMTGAQLAARLRVEPGIPAASTFTDRMQAEAAVSDLLSRNSVPIARWLGGSSPEAAFRADVGRPVGMILRRGASTPVPGSTVKAVLVRDGSPLGYHVGTAFLVR
jgi:hypothetical protein